MFAAILFEFFALILSIQFHVLAQSNETSEYSLPIRIDASGLEILEDDGIFINCTNCYINGDLSFAIGSIDETPDSNFSGLPFNFSQNWAAGVVEDFVAHFEFDFVVTSPQEDTEGSNGLIPGLDDGFTFHTGIILFGLAWTFNPTIHAVVNSSSPVNFTYGFEFTIPANSAVFIPLSADSNESVQAIGFNESKITPLNYTSPDTNEDFTFEISFRPIFEVALDALWFIKVGSASVFADVPKLDVTVSQVHNTTRDCMPAPLGTPQDQIFNNLTYVVPTLGYDVGFDIELVGLPVASEAYPLGDNKTLTTSCLIYSADAHGLVALPVESNSWRSTTVTSRAVFIWTGLVICMSIM